MAWAWPEQWPQPELIAKLTLDIAADLKSENHEVKISNIIVTNDRFKIKANKVNEHYRKMYYERNFSLIDHSMST